MKAEIHYRGQRWAIDYGTPTDLSIPVRGSQGIEAWGVGPALVEPHRWGEQTFAISEGSAVNFYELRFSPHAHCTHTETLGHIREQWDSVNRVLPFYRGPARLVTVRPEVRGEDRVIDALPAVAFEDRPEALIVRSLPNPESRRSARYSDSNPPYFSDAALREVAHAGIWHLLTDVPSVDPERDGGALAAHRAFWGLEQGVQPRECATITELIYVPSEVEDGLYWLELQVAPVECDAAPSRPLIYPIIPTAP